MMKMRIPKFFKSVRYMLAAVNGLFLLTGILFILTGVTVLIIYQEYETLITNRFFSLPTFVIATGVIICLNAVLGFYAAISEQFYAIAAYVVLLIVLLVFEISTIAVAFNLRSDAASDIRPTMAASLQLYESRIEVARTWDLLQMEFECCGVSGRGDWGTSRIPVSCCHIDYGTVSPFECTLANAHSTGCSAALGDWLAYNAHVVALTAIVVTCLQVLITAASGWFAWRSKFEEVELES